MSQFITLFHVSPAHNHSSIVRRGLVAALATGAKPLVWLCRRGLWRWAVQHVADRWQVSEVAIYRVRILRSDLRRFSRGKWMTPFNIHPENIHLVTFAACMPTSSAGRAAVCPW